MSSRHLRYASLAVLYVFAAASFNASVLQAQEEIYTGRNINMVSGTQRQNEQGQRVALGGDPFLQRQNEPSIAVSSRNPMHLMAGSNDYRTVDMSGLQDIEVIGDSWLGLYKSFDGGQTWQNTLMPGYPQARNEQEGLYSPIHGYQAGADPTVKAGTNGMFYYSGIAFDRGHKSDSVIFVSRFIDLNNREGANFDVVANKDPIKFIDTQLLRGGTPGQFTDKPWMAVDIPRGRKPKSADLYIEDYREEIDFVTGQLIETPVTVHQQFACGNVYVAYAVFLGQDEDNPHTRVEVVRSTDCGKTWGSPVSVSDFSHLNQGVTLAIDPGNGDLYVAWQVFDYDTQVPQIMLSKSTDGGVHFSKPLCVATTLPFNQGTRPIDEYDPFRLFRTNAYPTMAIDDMGKVYIAWSERGLWGTDFLENWDWENDPPYDGVLDGSRIMFTYSEDYGESWVTPYSAVMSDFLPDNPDDCFTENNGVLEWDPA
ncbi:MAG: sialidase family protein, partial [Acidobacteriota bacterium]